MHHSFSQLGVVKNEVRDKFSCNRNVRIDNILNWFWKFLLGRLALVEKKEEYTEGEAVYYQPPLVKCKTFKGCLSPVEENCNKDKEPLSALKFLQQGLLQKKSVPMKNMFPVKVLKFKNMEVKI